MSLIEPLPDAPWKVIEGENEYFALFDAMDFAIAFGCGKSDADRLSLLPDLYKALAEAAWEMCQKCEKTNRFTHPDSFIRNGCEGKAEFCPAVYWWDLLRKVRDGK